MDALKNETKLCTLCKKEYTSIHVESQPGVKVYVCNTCLEKAKHNFIWVCMHCGQVHMRPKQLVIQRLQGSEENENIRKAYAQCVNMQIIQGISRCICCSDIKGWC